VGPRQDVLLGQHPPPRLLPQPQLLHGNPPESG
jgi:hypothetical protein